MKIQTASTHTHTHTHTPSTAYPSAVPTPPSRHYIARRSLFGPRSQQTTQRHTIHVHARCTRGIRRLGRTWLQMIATHSPVHTALHDTDTPLATPSAVFCASRSLFRLGNSQGCSRIVIRRPDFKANTLHTQFVFVNYLQSVVPTCHTHTDW
jgi:hypothetical protein